MDSEEFVKAFQRGARAYFIINLLFIIIVLLIFACFSLSSCLDKIQNRWSENQELIQARQQERQSLAEDQGLIYDSFTPEELEKYETLSSEERQLFFSLEPADRSALMSLPSSLCSFYLNLSPEQRLEFQQLDRSRQIHYSDLDTEEMIFYESLSPAHRLDYLGIPSYAGNHKRVYRYLSEAEREDFSQLFKDPSLDSREKDDLRQRYFRMNYDLRQKYHGLTLEQRAECLELVYDLDKHFFVGEQREAFYSLPWDQFKLFADVEGRHGDFFLEMTSEQRLEYILLDPVDRQKYINALQEQE